MNHNHHHLCQRLRFVLVFAPNGTHRALKALDTFGNCQRSVFSLIVFQHMYKITYGNLGSIEHRICMDNERKTPSLRYYLSFQMHNKRLQLKYFIIWVSNYFFLKNCVTSKEAVSHNVLYYHQLSIACYQVSFYANIYFG